MPYKVTLPPGEPMRAPQGVSPIPEKSGDTGDTGDTTSIRHGTVAGLAPWALLSHPPDPRERLIGYLDAWAGMDESLWPEANVKALYDDIMDIFREHPEAESWYRAWRTEHPEAKLG